MTLQQIIQTAMITGLLTAAQEHEFNVKLFQQDLSPSDEFLLRRFNRALADGSISQIEKLDALAVGQFPVKLTVIQGGEKAHSFGSMNPKVS
jgi:hypothetical protein